MRAFKTINQLKKMYNDSECKVNKNNKKTL